MLIHQSELASFARCAAQVGYTRAGWRDDTNSAAAFGSVMHHALHVFERERNTGTDFGDAVQMALETFVHYWNPLNIESITEPVPPDGWLPRQSYAEMRSRGIESIKKYCDLVRYDDLELLAIEYGFVVPIVGTWDDDLGEPHMLGGTIDRLAMRHYKRQLCVAVDDWKTGKDYRHLRHNLQFSAYCYATTQQEFWVGYRGEDGFGEERGTELYLRGLDAPRRATWINLRLFKFQDAGWRGPIDYARFALAVEQYVATIKADIFPLTVSGETCTYCPFRKSCGGTGLPDDEHGKPEGL